MAKLNAFGYMTEDGIDTILTPEAFDTYVGGVFSSTRERKEAVLAGVSSAVRTYCGWHVAPHVECGWTGEADGNIVKLPAMNVSRISSLVVDGVELSPDEYDYAKSGVIRLHRRPKDTWNNVSVRFFAGIPAETIEPVIAQIASNNLAATPGVREEHVGDAGISYNQTGYGVSGGTRLLASDKELLAPWRLGGN